MTRYIVWRFASIIPTMFGLMVLAFFILRVIPGNPAAAIAGDNATPAQIEAIREKFGFDQPLYIQFVSYLKNIARLDFGNSFYTQRPVIEDVLYRLPATLELIFAALLLATVVGVPLGTIAAVAHNSNTDRVVRVATVAGLAMASFWVGLILQLLFSMRLGWLPLGGRLPATMDPPPGITGFYLLDSLMTGRVSAFVEALRYLTLPSITLAIAPLATIARFARASVLQVLQMEFVAHEVALGFSRRRIIWIYVLRNALGSTLTQLGLLIGSLLSGAVAVEAIFNWPGLGLYTVQAILTSDFNGTMAIILFTGLIFSVANVAVDIAYLIVDPRIAGQA